MRTIKLLVLALVSVAFVGLLSGCAAKEEKMSNYLLRKAADNASRVYNETGFSYDGHTFNDWNVEVRKPIITSIKTKEVMGVTTHYVKCKMEYFYTSKKGGRPAYFVWYAKLTVKEDGFGELETRNPETEEVFLSASSEVAIEKMEKRIGSIARTGKDLIS